MIYKDRLKLLREDTNLKQNEIANYLKINRCNYSKYETENIIMPIKYLNILSNYFNVSLDYLFNLTSIKNYDNYIIDFDVQKSASRLKELRKSLGITQEQFAKSIGTAKTTISGFERKENIIATPFLYDICKRYNVSADYLLGKIDDIPEWCKN